MAGATTRPCGGGRQQRPRKIGGRAGAAGSTGRDESAFVRGRPAAPGATMLWTSGCIRQQPQ